MKTKSLILAIALCLGLASAAPAAAQSVKFGIVAGMSLNKLNFNGDGGRFFSDLRSGVTALPEVFVSTTTLRKRSRA